MTIPEDQVGALFQKLEDIEKKVDTIHSGVYGDLNGDGLKKEMAEIKKFMAIPLAVSRLPNWLIGVLVFIFTDGVIGLMAHTELIVSLYNLFHTK